MSTPMDPETKQLHQVISEQHRELRETYGALAVMLSHFDPELAADWARRLNAGPFGELAQRTLVAVLNAEVTNAVELVRGQRKEPELLPTDEVRTLELILDARDAEIARLEPFKRVAIEGERQREHWSDLLGLPAVGDWRMLEERFANIVKASKEMGPPTFQVVESTERVATQRDRRVVRP